MSHFADCDHRIEQLTSGYRIAVVYNLCWSPSANQDNTPIENKRKIDHLFRKWTKNGDLSCLALPLDYSYTEDSLKDFGSKCLKGKDQEIANFLEKISDSICPLMLFLVFGNRKREGDEDLIHNDYECYIHTFYTWHNFHGQKRQVKMGITEDEMLMEEDGFILLFFFPSFFAH